MLTGVTFVGFASGFGVCLFDLDQIEACVTHADIWVEKFKEVGDHILLWGVQLVQAVLARHPLVP